MLPSVLKITTWLRLRSLTISALLYVTFSTYFRVICMHVLMRYFVRISRCSLLDLVQIERRVALTFGHLGGTSTLLPGTVRCLFSLVLDSRIL